ncbi:MAG: iron-sulfur cluster assembly protein [Chloroflexi bacterium]|jgi:metal-sulfur cluster biosynthetic enzyme|nr:iron-sulfur cluster assembly protein [Anaerolineaceae bacterium]NMB90601.1 iron-sulfur cluster assembly protein [Chloroflexota bacterium]
MSNQPGTNRPIWESESEFPELSEELRTGLSEVVDPEIGLNIIQLGLIRDVHIEPEEAKISMILTTPFCPYGPAMLETTRDKAQEVLKRPTFIDLGMEMWDFSMMEDGLGADWGLY